MKTFTDILQESNNNLTDFTGAIEDDVFGAKEEGFSSATIKKAQDVLKRFKNIHTKKISSSNLKKINRLVDKLSDEMWSTEDQFKNTLKIWDSIVTIAEKD